MLLSLSLVTPVGAHVGGTVGHLWNEQLLPLAKGVFYTKAQSNQRYLSPNETTRKFVWRVPNDVNTTLTSVFSAWDLQLDRASCIGGEIHAEVDAVTEHGSIVGSFVNNFGEVSLLREHGLGRFLRRGGAEWLRELPRSGWVVHVHLGSPVKW